MRTRISHKNQTSKEEDLTGLRRMNWNVLSSWGGYLVYIVAGFVMPRIIDRQIGQTALGIWDFSWSLVSYFGLTGMGIASSIDPFVARYRASGDVEKLRISVSSVTVIQMGIAFVVFSLSVTAFLALPWLFSNRLGPDIEVARWVIGLLGLSLAVQMAFSPFEGIIKGCHRWGLHNAINSGSYGATVLGMIGAIYMGGGLQSISIVYFIAVFITEIVRAIIAKKVCPEISIRLSCASATEASKMFRFGGKTFIASLSPLLLTQGVSILIAAYIGPASLAVFARPTALVRHSQVFLNKLAFVLTPITGSLIGSGKWNEIRSLYLTTSRYAVSITLPATLFFLVLGNKILRIWMGPQYEKGSVLAILALSYFLPAVQQVGVTIMTGLNQHGRIAMLSLVISGAGLALGALIFGFLGWNLERAALVAGVPLGIGNGLIVLIYACKALNIPLKEYIKTIFPAPVLCGVPFTIWLIASRIAFNDRPVMALLCGFGVGMLILAPLYWRFILTYESRRKIIDSLGLFSAGREAKREIL